VFDSNEDWPSATQKLIEHRHGDSVPTDSLTQKVVARRLRPGERRRRPAAFSRRDVSGVQSLFSDLSISGSTD